VGYFVMPIPLDRLTVPYKKLSALSAVAFKKRRVFNYYEPF